MDSIDYARQAQDKTLWREVPYGFDYLQLEEAKKEEIEGLERLLRKPEAPESSDENVKQQENPKGEQNHKEK